ncbi:hypothetical protein CsatB_008438 [Cannabis sativa]|uniref:Uncharacterized protein n=1 Tax=Cannabis sativa TaxID=3483 RepID=A0A803QWM3_CANSA
MGEEHAKSSMCGGTGIPHQVLGNQHYRCWNLIQRWMSRRHNNQPQYHHHHHHHHQSSDFSYDLSSYALNFEDDSSRDDDEFHLRDFSSRLPASPTPPPPSFSAAKCASDSSSFGRGLIVGF